MALPKGIKLQDIVEISEHLELANHPPAVPITQGITVREIQPFGMKGMLYIDGNAVAPITSVEMLSVDRVVDDPPFKLSQLQPFSGSADIAIHWSPAVVAWRKLIEDVDVSWHTPPVRIHVVPAFRSSGEEKAMGSSMARLEFTIKVRDRDTGGPNEITMTAPTPPLEVLDPAENLEDALHWLRSQLHALVTHEMDEQFRYKGKRVHEPHPRRER